MTSDVFRPFFDLSTLLTYFLPTMPDDFYLVTSYIWRLFLTPLPSLKLNVIYGRSLSKSYVLSKVTWPKSSNFPVICNIQVSSNLIFEFLNSVKNVLKSIFEITYFIFWTVNIITLLGKFQTDTEVSRSFGLKIWLLWGRSSFLASTEALILLRSSIKLSYNLIASSRSGRRCFQLLISGGFFNTVFPTRHWVCQGKTVK